MAFDNSARLLRLLRRSFRRCIAAHAVIDIQWWHAHDRRQHDRQAARGRFQRAPVIQGHSDLQGQLSDTMTPASPPSAPATLPNHAGCSKSARTMMSATGAIKPVYQLMKELATVRFQGLPAGGSTGYYSTSKATCCRFPSFLIHGDVDQQGRSLKKAGVARFQNWPECSTPRRAEGCGHATCGFSSWATCEYRAVLGWHNVPIGTQGQTASMASTPWLTFN